MAKDTFPPFVDNTGAVPPVMLREFPVSHSSATYVKCLQSDPSAVPFYIGGEVAYLRLERFDGVDVQATR